MNGATFFGGAYYAEYARANEGKRLCGPYPDGASKYKQKQKTFYLK